MTDSSTPPVADTVMLAGKPTALAEAQRMVKSSATWFWWVAALSLVNSIAVMLKLQYGMMLGLGLTQVIDALFLFDADGKPANIELASRVIHLLLVLVIAGGFVAIGWFARAGGRAAYLTGMLLYAADSLLFALAGDWVGVGFHAFVLFMLWGGYSVLRAIRMHQAAAIAVA